ncbi:hypothetical protein pdam_00021623 [Pocillopora damicornis]|uniref:Apple domain-containing protein n=1 Tax=Pocillopora damicornis TaxID=46731 RepID=A0A3M6UGY0_POCDA|nr:hypothetical protein pdam_00021623 [Pocillopora damicornis]
MIIAYALVLRIGCDLAAQYTNAAYLMVLFLTGQTPNVGFVFANFLAHKGYYLNITTVGTELVQDSSECVFKCLEKDPCLSFNLADLDDNIDNLLCELLPSDHYTHSDNLLARGCPVKTMELVYLCTGQTATSVAVRKHTQEATAKKLIMTAAAHQDQKENRDAK